MKKILFSVIFVVMSLVVYADDDTREIGIRSVNTMTRSITTLPEASISNDVLIVSFHSSGLYSLIVYNCYRGIVLSSQLPADGMEYDYDISGIGKGMFHLVLDGPGGMYEGYFTIN